MSILRNIRLASVVVFAPFLLAKSMLSTRVSELTADAEILGRELYGTWSVIIAVGAFAVTSLVFLFAGIRNLFTRRKFRKH
jgi:hypothetical protein